MVRLAASALDDFIRPSQACIKPITTAAPSKNDAVPKNDKFGLHVEIEGNEDDKSAVRIATVSLNDCLACSGCVTSAETVLVEQQSLSEVISVLKKHKHSSQANVCKGDCCTSGEILRDEMDINDPGHDNHETKMISKIDRLSIHSRLEDRGNDDTSITVASFSPQTRAAFAALWQVNTAVAHRRLIAFLRTIGFDIVIDTNYGRSAALCVAEFEFLNAFQANRRQTLPLSCFTGEKSPTAYDTEHAMLNGSNMPESKEKSDQLSEFAELTRQSIENIVGKSITEIFPLQNRSLPILSSSCPGWICYAEKMQHNLLEKISNVRSPQQITGRIVKLSIAHHEHLLPRNIYHIAIMPCFDKKLEASRPEFAPDNVRDVDCVLTTREILEWMQMLDINANQLDSWYGGFINLESNAKRSSDETSDYLIASGLPSYLTDIQKPIEEHPGSSSGGYAAHILTSAARTLFNIETIESGRNLLIRSNMNSDLITYTLQDEQGNPLLRVATCYGFRNIQNLVRRWQNTAVRRRRARDIEDLREFDWIEVMACPSGCINGGGQIRMQDVQLLRSDKAINARGWIDEMEKRYHEKSKVSTFNSEELQGIITGLGGLGNMLTTYNPVPKDEQNMLQLASVW